MSTEGARCDVPQERSMSTEGARCEGREAAKESCSTPLPNFASFAARTYGAQARCARTSRELMAYKHDTASREEREAAKESFR
ncbi:hypothetical protein [Methanoculleus chikugoensis]|uniref:hypothetical protein n=1 Tax=Methanoculleus chikugoensis TaxID=118126 RepID=UPI001FB5401B|nr:hypothetical protein [Methanoculleus chikugoensis]